ncbi:MAG: winged helix-turn-helix transcriptional regulator [Myxococcales bacterium FL481]|nr:MAG: winged helix-turn-helix transcriptional regulator [Myxococcales bacterium FL481]
MSGLPASSSDAVLDALGNATRRDMLQALGERPRTVGELGEAFPISRPAVSKHLKVLETAGLVRHVSEGTRNIYELDLTGFEAARRWLDGFWDQALARFRLLAENSEPGGQR